MHKMNDPNKDFVVFNDKNTPKVILVKKKALKDSDFDDYTYSHDHSEITEVWVKNDA